MFFGPKCGECFSKKKNWRHFQKNRGIMLPHDKYYSVSILFLAFWRNFASPKKNAALLYTSIDETSTPNMLPSIYPCTCHPAIIQKMENGMPSSSLQMPTYVRSLLQSCWLPWFCDHTSQRLRFSSILPMRRRGRETATARCLASSVCLFFFLPVSLSLSLAVAWTSVETKPSVMWRIVCK